jgi:alpha-L-rhamnosidase
MNRGKICILVFYTLVIYNCHSIAQSSGMLPPTGLTTDLIEHTDAIWMNGHMTSYLLSSFEKQMNTCQIPEILTTHPIFGWIVNDDRLGVLQTGYQILVASREQILAKDSADIWNSGMVLNKNSVAVKYEGKNLESSHLYFWKVRTQNNGVWSTFSDNKAFKTAAALSDYGIARYPVEKSDEPASEIRKIDSSLWFVDFGKAAFGRIRLTLQSFKGDNIQVHLGEAIKNDRLDRTPGGTIRYRAISLSLLPGRHTYTVVIPADKRNTGPAAIKIPGYIGEVMPFRYAEIDGFKGKIITCDAVRETAHYPFNEMASSFSSSDKVLNDVWELCKYTIKATSFAGVYVDGDRERIPYEADAFINQLCHYSVDREYSMARYSQEYLISHATWPTEWILQSVIMAWNDYLYTGNQEFIKQYYPDLKAKALMPLRDENNLISTKTGKQNQGLMESVHYNGKELRDIVDWPQTGILGLGKNEPGETDGFVFKEYNTVVNAYHYKALCSLTNIARSLGYAEDARLFSLLAEKTRQAINQQMFDRKKGIYVDGIGTSHASLHANMFALAFEIVPEQFKTSVMDFVRSRGMACSVYGSQFLIDAVYNAGDAAYGLSLLSSKAERSWAHMIYDVGSTMTLEAWDNKYKPNQDWNHAWGSAPANLISRKLMGIEPLEPGFEKIQIKPQPASLEKMAIVLPTIRGSISASLTNKPDEAFELSINIPANTTAYVIIPWSGNKYNVMVDHMPVRAKKEQNFILLPPVGSGEHFINCTIP